MDRIALFGLASGSFRIAGALTNNSYVSSVSAGFDWSTVCNIAKLNSLVDVTLAAAAMLTDMNTALKVEKKLSIEKVDKIAYTGKELIAIAALIVSLYKATVESEYQKLNQFAAGVQVLSFGVKYYQAANHLGCDMGNSSYVSNPSFLTDLTESKEDVICLGRSDVIDNVLVALSAGGDKHNVLLVANPGTGKTNLAKGIADKIRKDDIHENFKGYRVYMTSSTELNAGCAYRGSLEGNIKALFDFLEKQGKTILFIDEIHNLIGTGSGGLTTGGPDISQMMLDRVTRPNIKVIGCTTFQDGKKLNSNGAFLSRFKQITLAELTREQKLEVLNAEIEKYKKNEIDLPNDLAATILNLQKKGESFRDTVGRLHTLVANMKYHKITYKDALAKMQKTS